MLAKSCLRVCRSALTEGIFSEFSAPVASTVLQTDSPKTKITRAKNQKVALESRTVQPLTPQRTPRPSSAGVNSR